MALVAQAPAGAARTVPLRAGMVITTSTTIRPGTYRLSSGAIERPAIVVRGSNICNDNDFYRKRFLPRACQRHRGDVQPQPVPREPRGDNWHGVWGGYSYDTE